MKQNQQKTYRLWFGSPLAITLGMVLGVVIAGTGHEGGLPDMLSMTCSDNTFSIINEAVVVGFAWAQVRQLIPAEWMAKLPTKLIVFLEFVAANRGSANNDLFHNPCYHKRKINSAINEL